MMGASGMSVQVLAALAAKIGFASHQNAVPLFRELDLVNRGDTDLDRLVLSLVADPPFIAARAWPARTLSAGQTLRITDRDIELDAGYLAGLTENLTATLRLQLTRDDEVLDTHTYSIEVLSRHEWGGAAAMPELLAAFCLPNDPAVDRVLKAASDVLLAAGKPSGIDGYQAKSRTRCWELASAIWSAVVGLRLSYALPAASFEQAGQKIRPPGALIENGVATCLDTALLFAAALEQAGLNALLVLTDGHAFAGVWLQPQEFAQLITDEAAAVRKRVDLQELLVFETTLATQAPACSFSEAVRVGQRQLADEGFLMAIDLRRARMQRIRPLALPVPFVPGEDDALPDAPVAPVGLDAAPALPGFDVELESQVSTPAGKLALWQRKLLDLTTRNRLLHLPDSAKGVRLVCAEPTALEDLLADGKRIRIVAMPDLAASGRDEALFEQQNNENLRHEYARAALERSEVLATVGQPKLDAALVDLYRRARSDLDEGGANTLFLALGFLKWKKTPTDPKTYSAPLILLPVKLERKSASSGVTMTLSEDEPRFNLTLLELLRHDFDLAITGLDGELPQDGNGIDVEGIWTNIRRAVRDLSGFEVTHELVLGTFSFAKYLMWKDLAERTDQLRESLLVRHLLASVDRSDAGVAADVAEVSSVSDRSVVSGTSTTSTASTISTVSTDGFLRPEALDTSLRPADLFTPLAADSSQLAAVVASASGRDFVLDGPPGTGKSQTIANMIAHNLALGRRVLFVAEKMAALEVVNRRLEEHGLGEFCLELHSNKTSKVEVLKQLERAWDVRETLAPKAWEEQAESVQTLRDKLNRIVALLHAPNESGMSVHQAMGRVLRDATPDMVRLSWPVGTVHDAAEMANMRDIARRLDLNASVAATLAERFDAIDRDDWSNSWQASLEASAAQLLPAAATLQTTCDALETSLGLPVSGIARDDWQGIDALIELAGALIEAHGLDLAFVFEPTAATRIAAAHNAQRLLAQYAETAASLSQRYDATALRAVDSRRLQADWEAAGAKFWFFATLAKKRVAKTLTAHVQADALVDVQSDLPKLARLNTLAAELDQLQANLVAFPGWAGLSSDGPSLSAALLAGERLRDALARHAQSAEQIIALRLAVSTLVLHANELLAPPGALAAALRQAEHARAACSRVVSEFVALSVQESPLPVLLETAQSVLAIPNQLKAWSDWCRVRDEAAEKNLTPLTERLLARSDAVSATKAFETAYARWYAAWAIDAEPLLRNFVAAEHTSDIVRFRDLVDRLSALSVRFTRARLCADIPAKNDAGKHSGYAVLRHELQKSRRHKPIRQLALEMGDALPRLAPCMLMSPLSIAQFLPPGQTLFDLVIFDEASQIAPWDAIGSIARGKQVVIAGDPRQMPPTSFFNRAATAGDDDTEEDMESILDECLATGVPSHSLNWHYRSRHESLIAFSNQNYYDNSLITFPAAVTRLSAVHWQRVPGIYAKGQGRNNLIEAQAIVAETVRRLTDPAFIAAGHSIGIITLNADQQTLVADLLDQARQANPQIEPFFQEDRREPVVVKNLETVQGDERDVILLGIGYGPTEADGQTMSMNFGPLNKDGGWRRLNVAITRARREMIVFTSFDPGMIDLNRTSARAVRDLKHFIEFAQRGPQKFFDTALDSGDADTGAFEQAVAQALRDRGWRVAAQIGVSRFRIDLGIVHPDRPDDYLAGVECDGENYRLAATARDRDHVRHAVLGGLGWNLVRVWSVQWWVDKEGAVQKLHDNLEALLTESRAQPAQATDGLALT